MSTQAELANDQAIEYWAQNQFDVAIAQWEEVVRRYPNVVEIHYNLGNAYVHQGQIELAIKSLNRALAIDPTLVEAYNKLGCIYYKQGNMNMAAFNWKQALTIQPSFKEAQHNLRLMESALQPPPEPGAPTYQHIKEDSSPYDASHTPTVQATKLSWKDRARQRLRNMFSRYSDPEDE
jgi:tetratricopeptide (TPR) repeat protein